MKTVTIALIGGGFAGDFHANAYAKVSGIEVKIKTLVDVDLEKAKLLAQKWGIAHVTADYDEVLADAEIDAVDIVLPPHLHIPFIDKALAAGKHIISEKPLTGYFGKAGDQEPIGNHVPKLAMYESLVQETEAVRRRIKESNLIFGYAENYIYSPSVVRAGEMLRKKKSKIIYMKGEGSIRGSTSSVAGYWSKTGGGSLIRMGCHPIAGMLWLKQQEAIGRGETVKVQSVTADIGCISQNMNEYDRRHLTSHPVDVDDFAAVTMTFSHGSKAVSLSTDNVFGGVRNNIEIHASDGSMLCNMTSADNMKTYFMDDIGLEDMELSEQLKEKLGWNNVFVAPEVLRGYRDQFQNFVECIAYNKQPESGIDLACDTIRVIYAAYAAAENACRIEINE